MWNEVRTSLKARDLQCPQGHSIGSILYRVNTGTKGPKRIELSHDIYYCFECSSYYQMQFIKVNFTPGVKTI